MSNLNPKLLWLLPLFTINTPVMTYKDKHQSLWTYCGSNNLTLYPTVAQVKSLALFNPQKSFLCCRDLTKRLENISCCSQEACASNKFFLEPERNAIQLSPDGAWISILEPTETGSRLFIAPQNDVHNTTMLIDTQNKQPIAAYGWCYNTDYLWFLQDANGDENYHAYSINCRTKKIIDLTPSKGVSARILQKSPKHIDQLLLIINKRDPKYHDVYLVDIATGKAECIEQNKGFNEFFADQDFQIRIAVKFNEVGEKIIYQKNAAGLWQPLLTINIQDVRATTPLALTADGQGLYMATNCYSDTAVLSLLNLNDGSSTVLLSDPKADVGRLLFHPASGTIEAACFNYIQEQWKFIDPTLEEHYRFLQQRVRGELHIVSRNQADTLWLICFTNDLGNLRYFLYHPTTRHLHLVRDYILSDAITQPSPMLPQVITSRDNLSLVSYLTLPWYTDPKQTGRPWQALPMVLLVHGGPHDRDVYGFNEYHQILANQGYAVLSVNFRGSTGLGKTFVNAGCGQWGDKILEDLVDAVNWAVQEQIALPDKIAIMGGSFGGYATIACLTNFPELFVCGIDICGSTNLTTMLTNLPSYWESERTLMYHSVGANPYTSDGQNFLRDRSPIYKIDNITKPLLVAHGTHDPRVSQAESDCLVEAMLKKNLPTIYAIFPNEGHGCIKPKNQLALMALIEQFLATHLKNEFTECNSDHLKDSSLILAAGSQYVGAEL